jgi:glyoxylase I family protein
MSAFKALHHVSMIISDLDKSLAFYCDVLGLSINQSRPDMTFIGAWLDINEHQQIHLLQIQNPDPITRPQHGGRDRHTALITSDITSIEKKLENANISYTKSQSGRAALFCRDPDGNTLEIIHES